MSKAILVINNMPEKCSDCPLHEMSGNFDKHLCVPKQKSHNKFSNKKPDWCPLQLMPEHSHTGKSDYYQWGDWEDGWNACIDGLLSD